LLEAGRLLGHAVAIADALEHQALWDEAWGASWLRLYRSPSSNRLVEYALTAPWLYSGTAGVGLFLANLAAVTGNRRHERLARETLRSSELAAGWLSERGEGAAAPPGGFVGASSVAYALGEVVQFLSLGEGLDSMLVMLVQSRPTCVSQMDPPRVKDYFDLP
jgi:lantibiotic modifying enzyme